MNADKEALEKADRLLTYMMDTVPEDECKWITAAREAVRDALEEEADDASN